MPDEPTPGLEPTPDDGPAPPSPPPSEPPKGPDPKDAPEAFSREYVEELRREAATHRKKAADLEKWRKEHEDAQLSEQERKDRELAEARAETDRLKAERHALVVRHAVEREAVKLGFADADDAPRFVDLAAIELDESGQPQGIARLLKDVLTAKPHLKGTPPPTGVPGTPRPANGDLSDAERARQAVSIKQLW